MVEHPKGTESLTIHMVRVLSLLVESAYASLTVEYLKVLSLTVEPAYASSPLPYGRAPKGPYQSST
jgi:hypothetical protein